MNEASRWRVQLARELSLPYVEHDAVEMLCLGGSSARGISDAYSDLDIIVYWREMDDDFIRESPLEGTFGIGRTALMSLHPGTFIESYHIDGLKVDFGHSTIEQWKEWVTPIIEEDSAEPALIGMVGGFLSSIPFCGEGVFREWRDRLSNYSDQLARKVIGRSMGIYVRGYLQHQCLERGDRLAWNDGVCSMLKRMIDITAAINGRYYSAEEPRWLEYHLESMPVRAEELNAANVERILDEPGEASEEMLYRIVDDTLGLVAERFPELSDRVEKRRSRMEELQVRACHHRPAME